MESNASNLLIKSSTLSNKETQCHSNILYLMMKIQPIFLLIFGFLANLFSFSVLIQPSLRRRPTFSYLAFLSLSNAFLSLIHASFTILGVYFNLTLENLPLFGFCRLLNRFLIDFLTHFSLYTLTAVDLDRVRTVTSKTSTAHHYSQNHFRGRFSCVPSFLRVCLIESIFVFLLFALNLHWLTSYGYTMIDDSTHQITMCTIAGEGHSLKFYEKYLTSILPIIELILFGIVPFSISLIATIIILRHVSVKYSLAHNKHLKQSRRRMELHLSILLISLNCVFLIFTTPHQIFNIYFGQFQRNLEQQRIQDERQLCSMAVTQKSLDLLQQCYFMSTFFLYILTNKRFRAEFVRLIECYGCCCHLSTKQTVPQPNINHHRLHKRNVTNNEHNGNALMVPSQLMVEISDGSFYDDDDDDNQVERRTL